MKNRVPCLVRVSPELHRLLTLRRLLNKRSMCAEIVAILEEKLGLQEMNDLEAFKMLQRDAPSDPKPTEC